MIGHSSSGVPNVSLCSRASLRLDDARVSLVEARDAQANQLLVSIKSGTLLAPDASMQEARIKESQAADDLAVAQSALAICEAACAEPVDFRGQIITPAAVARRRVTAGADVVIGAEVGKLLDAAYAAEREIVNKRVVIRYLQTVVVGADKEALDAFLKRPWLIHEFGDAWKRHEATAAWRKAREALTQDPDALLPIDFG
jgi:hypothetical protein